MTIPRSGWFQLAMLALLVGCAPPVARVSSSRPPTAVTEPTPTSTPVASPTPATSVGQLDQRREVSLPQAREELAAAALDGTLFVIGGFDSRGRDTNTVFTYNGSWSLGPALPEALDHPAAGVLFGQLYIAGGFSVGRARATVYRFAQDHWEVIASLHHPRAAFALIPLGARLYALGGRNTAMSSVAIPEVYNPASGTWTDLPALPAARHHVAGFVYQNMVCAAGGKFPYTARVDCLDPTSRMWHRLPDLPAATSGAGAVILGGHVFVVGGEGNAVVPWLFSFTGDAWQRQQMLLPRHGTDVAILGDRAWVCGGGTVAGLYPTSLCTSIAVAQ
jgi:Kelch motif